MPLKSLADAGLIIAYLDPTEGANHKWAVKVFSQHSYLGVCEAVIAEACARLAYMGQPQFKVLQMVEEGVLRLEFSAEGKESRLARLMEKYADLPMDFADACLVVMAEEHRQSMIYTLDKNDFKVYRRNGRELIPFRSP